MGVLLSLSLSLSLSIYVCELVDMNLTQ
jgi:hypothetical protein